MDDFSGFMSMDMDAATRGIVENGIERDSSVVGGAEALELQEEVAQLEEQVTRLRMSLHPYSMIQRPSSTPAENPVNPFPVITNPFQSVPVSRGTSPQRGPRKDATGVGAVGAQALQMKVARLSKELGDLKLTMSAMNQTNPFLNTFPSPPAPMRPARKIKDIPILGIEDLTKIEGMVLVESFFRQTREMVKNFLVEE